MKMRSPFLWPSVVAAVLTFGNAVVLCAQDNGLPPDESLSAFNNALGPLYTDGTEAFQQATVTASDWNGPIAPGYLTWQQMFHGETYLQAFPDDPSETIAYYLALVDATPQLSMTPAVEPSPDNGPPTLAAYPLAIVFEPISPATSVTVPEPASFSLAVLACTFACRRRRRRIA
jgi:hypothetical protein